MRHGIIIGGTRSLGFETARFMAARSWKISAIGRTPISTVEYFPNAGSITFYSADIQNEKDINSILNIIEKNSGLWDALIFSQRFRGNNDPWDGEWKTSLEATRKIVDNCVSRIHNHQENRYIVIVGSNASHFDVSDQHIAYHVVRAALEQAMRSWAVRLAPKGIRVNMVCPNMVRKSYLCEPTDFEKLIPLGYACKQSEIASVINFLCSEDSQYVTGQTIMIDGGLSLVSQLSCAKMIIEK